MNLPPWKPWRWAIITISGTVVVLGVLVNTPWPSTSRRRPAWAIHLAPLRHAPLPTDRPVPLILPQGVSPPDAERLVMESVWQCPEVQWRPMPELPTEGPFREAVILEPGPSTGTSRIGWHRSWHRGWVSVFRRTEP